MTREEIEKISVTEQYLLEERWYKIGCIDGLKADDIKPNLESLWHETTTQPELNEWFIAQIGDDAFDTFVMSMTNNKDWKNWSNGINMKRWAYVRDLLPKQFRNSEQLKETKKMNRYEQIINEAEKFFHDAKHCYNAFVQGAAWADAHPINVWHDASEEPNENSEILIQWNIERNSGYESYYTRSIDNWTWTRFVERYRVPRWAYVRDLLPKGGEQ